MSDNEGTKIKLPTFTCSTAEGEIRRIAMSDTSCMVLLDHAKDRMLERDITLKQVLNVLRHGDICDTPKWNTDNEKGWKCKFARVTAGIKVTVVCKLVERAHSTCLIVTVF